MFLHLKLENYLHIKRGEITNERILGLLFESNKLSKKDNQKLLLENLERQSKVNILGTKK